MMRVALNLFRIPLSNDESLFTIQHIMALKCSSPLAQFYHYTVRNLVYIAKMPISRHKNKILMLYHATRVFLAYAGLQFLQWRF